MAQRLFLFALALALVPVGLTGGAEGETLRGAFGGIELGASKGIVHKQLQGMCRKLSEVNTLPPILPIARDSEAHLVCLGLKVDGGGSISEAAFSFAEGVLAFIEFRKGAIEALIPGAGELSASLAGYDAYLSSWTLAHPAQDAVWVLTESAARANLFLWRNPALPSNANERQGEGFSVNKPAILSFGAALDEMTNRLKEACQGISVKEIETVWLPSKPRRQTQIDCYGYPFAGFPRKIEAVFGDGRLQLAWILTGKGEEDRLRKALVAEYGPIEIESANYESLAGGRVALRKDRPEVLLLSEELVPLYRKIFSGED